MGELTDRHKAMSYARMQHTEAELKKQIDALLARTKATDEADAQRGCSDDDDRRPRGPDGKPRGGRYARDFGVPKDGYPDLAVGVSIRQDT